MAELLDANGLSYYSGILKGALANAGTLPTYNAANAGQVLTVDSNGTTVEWANGGSGSDEIYVGNGTPSASEYKMWINPDGEETVVVSGISFDGNAVTPYANGVVNLTTGDNINVTGNQISAVDTIGYPVTTEASNLTWNKEVLRSATDTTAISAVQPSVASTSQEIGGYFLANGSTCTFTVANATIQYEDTVTTNAGDTLSVDVNDGSIYEFSLVAMSNTATLLLMKEW